MTIHKIKLDKMAKITMFETNDSTKVKVEIDDVFDEMGEKAFKIENEKQVQYMETDDVFDEIFDRKVDLSYHKAELENRLSLTVKCLCKEEEDDVFDEEREKKDDVNDTRIKREVGEYSDNLYEENLGLLNMIKEEIDLISNTEEIHVFNTMLKQNIVIDNKSFIEVDEQEVKVEVDETEGTRINEYNCRKHTIFEEPSFVQEVENSKKDGRSAGTGIQVEGNNNYVEIIQHSIVDSGRKEAGVKTVMEMSKHVREGQTKTNKTEIMEQRRDVANGIIFIDITGDKKKLAKEGETCNRKQSDREKQQSYTKHDKEKKMYNWPEVSGNTVNTTGKNENIDQIPKDLPQKTILNNEASNTGNRDSIKEYIQDQRKSSVSVPNKTLNGEEKRKHHEKQSPKIIPPSDETQERLHKVMKLAETLTAGKENIEETVTETIHNKKYKIETHSRTNLENIEYCCTKCSFRTKHRTAFKTHLSKHGTEFFSGVISFLDLVHNETVATSQYESGQVLDEIKEQCTDTHIIMYNEAQTEGEKKTGNEDEVDACKSVQSSQVTDKNSNGDNEQSEIRNIENNTICERNGTVVLCKENESFLIATNIEVISQNSENQIVQNETLINKIVNSEIELLESKIENKRKVGDQNENGEVLIEENNTVSVVTIIEKEEALLQFNKSEENILKAVTNVDGKSENMENLITQSQILKAMLESPKPNKRKQVQETSSASKKIKLKKDKIYHCDECSYRSHKKRYFDNHRIIHSKDVIKCDYCNFTTNLQRYMTSHMLRHLQPEEIKMYKCPHCSYQTRRRGDLPIHMVLHKKPEEIKMFQCDKCPYKTKRKTNLRSHEFSHKSASDLPMYSCARCLFTTKKKHNLKSHMIIHQKTEEILWYKCDQCSYTSKYKAGLNRHGLVHKNIDEIRTYDCPLCPYKAKHKSHLKSHLLIHKDPKEVEMHCCEHCSYKSIKKCNLVAHMLQHKKTEEINMKKCGQCSYQTKLKCNLLKHINRIHNTSRIDIF